MRKCAAPSSRRSRCTARAGAASGPVAPRRSRGRRPRHPVAACDIASGSSAVHGKQPTTRNGTTNTSPAYHGACETSA